MTFVVGHQLSFLALNERCDDNFLWEFLCHESIAQYEEIAKILNFIS